MKKIAILGSTGSIGTQTLDVLRRHPEDFSVAVLTAGHNIDLLKRQIREFRPSLAAVADEEDAKGLRISCADLSVTILSGMEGLIAAASCKEADMVVTAVVGMMGIRPTIAAIEAGKDIALANKETLVTAGHLIMPLAGERGVRILPVDSEHSAILQSWHGERDKGNAIERIWLTASGGPFRGKKREELAGVGVSEALKNPNWVMGRKVTIDSATLVNKGLEIIEAKWLFGVEPERISVVVHPQSIIHSMVQYADGAVIAQLGIPDMRLPIQYALCYPERKALGGERIDFTKLSALTFEEPDEENFPGLKLARRAAEAGGNMPAALNAADEKAVDMFLKGEISFPGITDIIEYAMDRCTFLEDPGVEGIFETQRETAALIEGRW